MREVQLKPDGTLRIIPIEPDDDGLDEDWITLPDQERWNRVRAFMAFGTDFEPRFAKRDVSLRVARAENVFQGLPRSQAALGAQRRARDGSRVNEDFLELIRLMNEHGVEFILVSDTPTSSTPRPATPATSTSGFDRPARTSTG